MDCRALKKIHQNQPKKFCSLRSKTIQNKFSDIRFFLHTEINFLGTTRFKHFCGKLNNTLKKKFFFD